MNTFTFEKKYFQKHLEDLGAQIPQVKDLQAQNA